MESPVENDQLTDEIPVTVLADSDCILDDTSLSPDPKDESMHSTCTTPDNIQDVDTLEQYLNDTFDSVLEESLADTDTKPDIRETIIGDDTDMFPEIVHNYDNGQGDMSPRHLDLDFSAIQTTGHLDHGVSRQKVELCKRSTSKRRKPSRETLRNISNPDGMFEDSTEPQQIITNGNPDDVFEREAEQDYNSSSMEVEINNIPPMRTGRSIPGMRPIGLPAMLEISENKPKLRTTVKPTVEKQKDDLQDEHTPKPAWRGNLRKSGVPLEHIERKDSDQETMATRLASSSDNYKDEDVEEQTKTPAWRSSLRKSGVPLEFIEKKDVEQEQPAWMKNALEKKKRVVDIIQSKEVKETTSNDDSESEQPLAPWMKEAKLRKAHRPAKLKAIHHDPPAETLDKADVTVNMKQTADNRGQGDQLSMSVPQKEVFVIDKTPKWHPPKPSPLLQRTGTPSQEMNKDLSPKHSPLTQRRVTSIIDTSSSRKQSNKELSSLVKDFTPMRKSGDEIVDENTPPKKTRESFTIDKEDIFSHPSNKTHLPPLKSQLRSQSPFTSPQSSPRDEGNNENVPVWRAEMLARKKNRAVNYPVRSSDSGPIRMSETPQWKKDLMDKQKHNPDSPGSVQQGRTEESLNGAVPVWKQEFNNNRRKRLSQSPAPEKTDCESTPSEPEWKRQAEQRRSRLFQSGLINEEKA